MAKEWGTVKTGFDRKPRLSDLVKVTDLNTHVNKFRPYRFVGGVTVMATIWMPIYKDGKPLINEKGRAVKVPKYVTNYDPDTQEYDETKPCPYVEAAEKMNKYLGPKDQLRVQTEYYANAINRAVQEAKPKNVSKPTKEERKTGFKNMESDSWTPVEVMVMGSTQAGGVQGCIELNTIKSAKTGKKVAKPISDPKYGCDIMLKIDGKAKGAAKYPVNKADRSPLDEEELEYLVWDIDGAIAELRDTRKEAKIEADRMLSEFMKGQKKKKGGDDEDEDDDDMPEDIEDSPKSKKNKKKSSDDEDDDDPPFDTDDDEEEEKSSKKKKKSKKDEDEDEDDDDEPKTKKKKRKVEDEDEDDDDEEEEKSSKKKKKSKKDEDEDEDDEEEEKSSKKKKKKSRPIDEDDDDDDGYEGIADLPDDDDDDD